MTTITPRTIQPVVDMGLSPENGTGSSTSAALRHSGLDHHVVVFDGHRERLGLVGTLHQPGARLDRYRVLARAQPLRIAPRAPGADVELPRVPGAADDLALAGVAVIARPRPL